MIGILVSLVWWSNIEKDLLKVYFLDVGQGDAIYIRTPEGQDILIDGGPDNRVVEQLGKVMPFWDHSLDLVILTHPHADHVNGLPEVLARFQVKNILETGIDYYNPAYLEFKKIIVEKNIQVQHAQAGQGYNFGSVDLQVLYPFANISGQEFENINNTSVVIQVNYGVDNFLFMGDAEKEVEKELLTQGVLAEVEVLKVGHHGSNSSTSFDFLQKVKPEIAVIEVGQDNKFNHPHEITLQSLAYNGVEIYRTDEQGSVLCQTDGKVAQCMVY